MRNRSAAIVLLVFFVVSAGFFAAHRYHWSTLPTLPEQYIDLRTHEGARVDDNDDVFHTVRKPVIVKRVIDGDTVELTNGERLRLIGIDAPEQGTCYAREADDVLASFVQDASLQLEQGIRAKDQYGRRLGYLYSGSLFVNYELIRRGAAVAAAYPPNVVHEDLFAAVQQQAKNARRGLWGLCGGLHGSTSVDPGTQGQEPPSPECAIKGDMNALGERLYVLPGCAAYDATQIDVRAGERWFCTEDEAQAAGWRKAEHCP